MSETVQEIIARAIYEKRNGAGATSWGRLPASHKAPYLDDAAAAISSIDAANLALVPKEPMTADEFEAWLRAHHGLVVVTPALREAYAAYVAAKAECQP